MAIHSHGKRACEQVLSIFEELGAENVRSQRHRMEHLGLISEDQIERAYELGICLSFNVAILYYYADKFEAEIIGKKETEKWTPCTCRREKCTLDIISRSPRKSWAHFAISQYASCFKKESA